MVRTKSAAGRQRVVDDTDPDAAASCSERYSECHARSVCLGSTSHGDGDATDANAAARISESRAEGGAGDH